MASYKIELNSKPIQGTKEHKLMLRITADKKHARVMLDYAVKPNQFILRPTQEYKHIRQSNTKYQKIHDHIDEKIQDAKDAQDALNREGKLITAKSIQKRMMKPKSSSLKKIKDFRTGEDLKFLEVDTDFLGEFQSYLRSLGNNHTTIHGNLRAIKALIYKAIDKGLMEQSQNPFLNYKLKIGTPTRVRLNEKEIQQIEKLDLSDGALIWHVNNAFLFSYYTAGMRASDILMLKWENIQNGRLIYQMHKTGKIHSVKLIDKANHILSFYGPKNPDDYVFPFFSSEIDYSNASFLHNQISAKTALLNKYLKFIAEKAGIDKKISTHTARHSFADIARKKTDNIYNLSKTLGHSDLKITEAYLASFDEDAVDSTLDDVFN